MTLRIILLLILLVLPLIPTFWALIDIPRRRFSSTKKKVIWFLVVSTFPFVGAIVYIAIARRGTEPIKP
ncbi:MAG: PLD nuclease N-terminal domain-containing protein [Syntrophobacteraceae bacterium]|nr:PLD nuclease N-terminal domain-containing protein [Desulfobacteraceae bacterium]